MSEETVPQSTEADFTTISSLSASSLVIVEETLARFIETADVKAVYAEPVHQGETTVIPAAEVLCGMGFGVGSGGGGAGDGKGSGTGGGGGGGGRTFSRPAAVVVIDPQGKVKVKPVVDVTKIALASLTAIGFMVATISRMRRGKIA
jgi:uncharacterized spore protein YtfJ